MLRRNISTHPASRISQLAATAIICWSLGANTHIGSSNTLQAVYAAPQLQNAKPRPIAAVLPQNLQVLSEKDAELYRAIFAAQAKGNWNDADQQVAKLEDKRLLGHVLADRYQRRPASLEETRAWLASYDNLPEAADLYDMAADLPGFKAARLTVPAPSGSWAGSDSYGATTDFRTDVKPSSPASHRFMAKIDHMLHQGQPYAAKALFDTQQQKHLFSLNERTDLEAHIAAAFFYDGKTDDARSLAAEAVIVSQNSLALWISGLSAWKEGDNGAAARAFVRLAEQPDLTAHDRAAAAFWAYRAFKRNDNDQEATAWLKQAASQPHSFYGFLAAGLLGHDTAGSWQVPKLDQQNVDILAAHPAGWRALALLQIGRHDLAESELRQLNPQGQHDLQDAMLALAEVMHLPSLAFRLGGVAVNDNGKPYDAALYPLPPWQPAEGFRIDRALIYALMRRESGFDPEAVSERGACGLMQLMPATAHLIANDNAGKECSGRLLDPAYNMALGQNYVRRLAQEPMIGDNLLLLLTAYNSGPGKLAHWVDADTKKDPLLFIESLPVRETRDYVQQVLTHYWMYRARLAEPDASRTQLARGEWPRYEWKTESPQRRLREVRADGLEVVASSFEAAR